MDIGAEQLANRLTAAFNGGGAASSRPWLWRPLLRLLAQGRPVGHERIAEVTGKTVEEVREALSANPDTEYDERGRIVGSGLTLRPTPHRFEVDGRTPVEPATAVVSLVTPHAPASIRAAFCNQVHFFVTPDAARGWLELHPGAPVLPVAEAFALGGTLTRTMLAGDGGGSCC